MKMKFIKENLRVVIAVIVALVLIIGGVIFLALNKEETPDNNKTEDNREQQIAEITGMTGDDAIAIVKKKFYGDNYEFSVEITADSLYKVTSINTIDNSEIIYYVDPASGLSYVDIDTN